MATLPQILINGLIIGGVYALIAIGYALVYSVLRLINFAHSGVFTVGAFSTLVLLEWLHLPLLAVVPVVILIGAGLGVVIERLAYRPIRRAPLMVQLITALGVATVIENTVALIFGSDARSLPPEFTSTNVYGGWAGIHITSIQVLTLILAATLLACLWWLVMRTPAGRAMRAIADKIGRASCRERV